jgi:Tol biopolymer transport system component
LGIADLYVVPADGGEAPRQILQDFLRGGDGGWDWIASHPDGRISVLGMHRERLFGFYTVSIDGRQVTASKLAPGLPFQLLDTRPGQGNRVLRFEWNQTGSALFVEAITNEVRSVWRVRVDERTLEWLAAERMTTGTGDDTGMAVSRDGKRLAFTTEQKSSRLWLFPFDAVKARVTGEGQPVTPEGGLVQAFDLASSGRTVAYVLRQPGTSRVELWTLDLENRRSELVAQNTVGVSVSADGRSIGYALFRPNPNEWAVAVRLVGGPERLVSPWSGQRAFLPSDWTREGALLGSYLAPPSAPATLATWPSGPAIVDRPIRVVASRANTALWQGRISPNGRWLSVVADFQDRPGQGLELWIAPAERMDVKWTRIASDHHWADKPRWAPDGRTLYFMSRQSSSLPNMWGVRIDPETGMPVGDSFVVTKFDSPNHAISFDGMGIANGRAVLTMTSVKGNVWLLDGVDR